jgi:hypothetical protein
MITLNLSHRISDDLLIGVTELIESGELTTIDDVMSFLEKPHKWKDELVDMGFKVVLE